MAFDGANIWVANFHSNNVTKLRASDGALLGTWEPVLRALPLTGANVDSNNVTKLRASDGALLGTFAVGLHPDGLAIDGAKIWVANGNSKTVSKL